MNDRDGITVEGKRLVFLDIEASGLDERSYPIEIGWVDEDGDGDSVLVQPLFHWTYWSRKSESVHHLTREFLASHGAPVAASASRVADAVRGNIVVVDEPEWDGHWLRMLLAEAGLDPQYELRGLSQLMTTALAGLEDVLQSPGGDGEADQRAELASLKKSIAQDARDHAVRTAPRCHRAKADALHAWTMWRRACQSVSAVQREVIEG
jgi:hypothetical protein